MQSTPWERREPRTWPATLAVIAIAAFFGWGLPAVNERLPATAVEPAGIAVDLGNGVTVVTPLGWAADVAKMKPHETLALRRDTSTLVATTFPWTGTEAELVERTRTMFEGVQHYELRGTLAPMRTRTGLAGMTYAIFGPQVDGRVWVGLLPGGKTGFAVRVRGVAGQGDLALRDAQALVDSLQVKESP